MQIFAKSRGKKGIKKDNFVEYISSVRYIKYKLDFFSCLSEAGVDFEWIFNNWYITFVE